MGTYCIRLLGFVVFLYSILTPLFVLVLKNKHISKPGRMWDGGVTRSAHGLAPDVRWPDTGIYTYQPTKIWGDPFS